MKDLMIILCVLLVILTLISILGGSIRCDEDPSIVKVVQPESRQKEKFGNQLNTPNTMAIGNNIIDALSKHRQGSKVIQESAQRVLKPGSVISESKSVVEGFQGLEYAVF